ncbi:hypothetical pox protein [Squirrelpox virus]|uniref:A7L n=1 Tax=Squirrelpox virus TaxID=240426 RepID=Q1HTT7_9POXV|nr:hypothetical pox protein [Squirrelpox virus]ABD51449.1 A7L [Squirrelpox virus]CCD83198.1 hypothetical pox protein [Squirrelpox virus]
MMNKAEEQIPQIPQDVDMAELPEENIYEEGLRLCDELEKLIEHLDVSRMGSTSEILNLVRELERVRSGVASDGAEDDGGTDDFVESASLLLEILLGE